MQSTTPPPSKTTVEIAVLGLGPMGIALARQLLDAGHRVTVWNRSPRDLTEHTLDDATAAAQPGDAVRSADLVVLCLRDHAASYQVVERIAAELPSATVVVDTSSGTPEQARASAQAARSLGVAYVSGAIMVPTPMVGTDDCFVLYAGTPEHLAATLPIQLAFGGTSEMLGEDHGLPSALDLAMLDIYFAGMYGFVHAAALLRSHDISATRFLPYATSIVETLGGSLADLARSSDTQRFDTGQARLDMCLAILDHIVGASEEAEVDHRLPAVVRDASLRAAQRSPGETDWDCVAADLVARPG